MFLQTTLSVSNFQMLHAKEHEFLLNEPFFPFFSFNEFQKTLKRFEFVEFSSKL